jgi:hypothetical protein
MKGKRRTSASQEIFLQLEEDVNALENALAFYGDSSQTRAPLSSTSPAVQTEADFIAESS